jgi:hypothetical protein
VLNTTINTLSLTIHKKESIKEQKQKVLDKYSSLINKLCSECKKTFKEYYNILTYNDEIN